MRQPSEDIFIAWLNALDDDEFWRMMNKVFRVAEERSGDPFWYL